MSTTRPTREQMIEDIIEIELDVYREDSSALVDLLMDGCQGLSQMTDDEIKAVWLDQVGEDEAAS